MGKHTDFILSPITEILQDVISSSRGVGIGIETYPLSGYIMQSAFLKMTGAQEQKMKCICWELATNDYQYRYDRYTLNRLGECSDYKEKKIVYRDLLNAIKKYKTDFNPAIALNRRKIGEETFSAVRDLLINSNVSTWAERDFSDFVRGDAFFTEVRFATQDDLLENVLQAKHTLLYIHRNRCAHNTLSYQENLPTLNTLFNMNFQDDNYFVRFGILILIDNIFIELYKRYLDVLREY